MHEPTCLLRSAKINPLHTVLENGVKGDNLVTEIAQVMGIRWRSVTAVKTWLVLTYFVHMRRVKKR